MLHMFFENTIYRKHREKLLLILDLLIVLFSYLIAYWSKNDFQLRTMQLGLTGSEVIVGCVILLIIYACSFAFFKVYKSLWKYIGVDELIRLTASNILAMIIVMFLSQLYFGMFSLISLELIAGVYALIIMSGVRVLYRLLRRYSLKKNAKEVKTIVIGAGDAGNLLLRELRQNNSLNYKIVGFIDDFKKDLMIGGYPILGTTEDLKSVKEKYNVESALIAISHVSQKDLRRIYDECVNNGLDTKIMNFQFKNDTKNNSVVADIKIEDLLGRGEIHLEQKKQNAFLTIFENLFTLLPTILLVILFIMLFKLQGLGDKGKVYDAETTKSKITFNDVAGLDEEKQEMIEIVDFLKNPDRFYEMGAKIPRGVLLCGKPGTGKTLIAKAIAGEANVPFISMSGSEFIEMFAGLGASRVRKLFEKAKKIAPCIVFIDEIDAIGSRRTSSSGAESENNQTLNQLLVEMDGFDTEETIIVLAATNRPEMLDKALLRPGRFDRQINIALPDLNGREAILKIHAEGKKFAKDINLRSIAEDTAGYTGAELANILNEAAIIATINKHKAITNKDIEDANKKVTMGLEKHSRIVSDKDKKLTAYHEAGHAIVSSQLETQKDIKEVSIIPRGVAGGYTMYKTNEDKYYVSKTEMEEKLISLLGGRAAEKIALNDISTGASNDIEVATQIAKDMIIKYGMSDSLGPIYIDTEKDPYELQMLGEKFGDAIGAEVKIMLDDAYSKAQKLIKNNMDKLDKVAMRLMEKEIISAEEFQELIK